MIQRSMDCSTDLSETLHHDRWQSSDHGFRANLTIVEAAGSETSQGGKGASDS